jgi:hypothetical protein
MSKKAKPTAQRWRVTLIRGTPAKFLGYVDAPDETSAIEAAAKEFKIGDALRNRLVVHRDD